MRVARPALFRYYQKLLAQRALLGHPLQPRLVAEALLFDYRTLFTRQRWRLAITIRFNGGSSAVAAGRALAQHP